MPPENPPAPIRPATEPEPRRQLAARAAHWRHTRRLTALLLALWLATGFCTVFYARDLARLSVFGWPLSFYMAAQGASLVYLALIGVYAWRMRRLDRACARASGEAP
jgi:putative solute:sodium symporter small subunit